MTTISVPEVLRCVHCTETFDWIRVKGRRGRKPSYCSDSCRYSAYHKRHPGKKEDLALRYRNNNPMTIVVSHSRTRAKAKGIPHTLTLADMPPVPEVCPVLGTPIAFRRDGIRGPVDSSPSLDRIKPELGYVPGNIRWISMRANRIKDNATGDELRLVYEDALRLGY